MSEPSAQSPDSSKDTQKIPALHPYNPQVRDWQQSNGILFHNQECRDYFHNVITVLSQLDRKLGRYYRLELAVLCHGGMGDYESKLGEPSPTETELRRMAITNALQDLHDQFPPENRGINRLLYMTHPAKLPSLGISESEKLDYWCEIPPFLFAKMRPCNGPLSLEFFQRLHYLSHWGNEDGKKDYHVYLNPDFMPSTKASVPMNFGFEILEPWQPNQQSSEAEAITPTSRPPNPERIVTRHGRSFKIILNGGLIWHGPINPHELDLDNHQRKWTSLWGIHT